MATELAGELAGEGSSGGMSELLWEAFRQFTDEVVGIFESSLEQADSLSTGEAGVVELIEIGVLGSSRVLVLTFELYTLAAREPAFAVLTREWMRRSRSALQRHFDPATARRLDALIEGLVIHHAFDPHPLDPVDVPDAVRRLTRSRPRSR